MSLLSLAAIWCTRNTLNTCGASSWQGIQHQPPLAILPIINYALSEKSPIILSNVSSLKVQLLAELWGGNFLKIRNYLHFNCLCAFFCCHGICAVFHFSKSESFGSKGHFVKLTAIGYYKLPYDQWQRFYCAWWNLRWGTLGLLWTYGLQFIWVWTAIRKLWPLCTR